MSEERAFATPQEEFWAGDFGTAYIERNQGDQLLASNLAFFSRALRQAGRLESCVELGANIGMNLRALKLLHPTVSARGVEINATAAAELAKVIGTDNVSCGSLFDWKATELADLSMVKGVLIHIAPDKLQVAYERLYESSKRFILVAEYYNPVPVTISYRGHGDRLFKRDFAGELMDRYSDLRLVDYGFSYRRDPVSPQDDISWFLMEKRA